MAFKNRLRKMLLALILIVAGTWLGFAILLFVTQDELIFHPTSQLASVPTAIGLSYEDVVITTPDGVRLHGWFIPAENTHGVLLFLHGNAGNISHRLASLEIFNRLGLSTLIIDYRGYGDSSGIPTEEGTYTDAEAAWNYLTMERGYAEDNVIIFGRSLGGAVAAWLAARVEPAGIILESTFTSLKALASKYYPYMPIGLMLKSEYATREYLAAIKAPSLIIHSKEDEMIPYSHARLLYASAPQPRQLLTIRGGHDEGFLLSGDDYIQTIRNFINRVLG